MMENNKQLIADAYGKAMDAEYDAILAEDETEPHQFSERFEEKMNDLINGDASEKKGASRRRLRPIWLIAAAILLLAATACAVPSIRKSIAGFFVKMFGNHVEYTDPDITKDRIEEEYGLVPIPEGFEETTAIKNDSVVVTDYVDEMGNVISLQQVAKSQYYDFIDNENGVFEEETVNGIAIRVYRSEDTTQASWIEDGYYFSLSCLFQIDNDFFREIISNVKIK